MARANRRLPISKIRRRRRQRDSGDPRLPHRPDVEANNVAEPRERDDEARRACGSPTTRAIQSCDTIDVQPPRRAAVRPIAPALPLFLPPPCPLPASFRASSPRPECNYATLSIFKERDYRRTDGGWFAFRRAAETRTRRRECNARDVLLLLLPLPFFRGLGDGLQFTATLRETTRPRCNSNEKNGELFLRSAPV